MWRELAYMASVPHDSCLIAHSLSGVAPDDGIDCCFASMQVCTCERHVQPGGSGVCASVGHAERRPELPGDA